MRLRRPGPTAHRHDARLRAPTRRRAPGALVDIGRIDELKGIPESDGGLTIGALTTHAEIGDIFASAEYRNAMAAVYSRRALGVARSRAG